jgi:hypothetical protein
MMERIRVDWLEGIRKVVEEILRGRGTYNLWTLFQELQFHIAQLCASLGAAGKTRTAENGKAMCVPISK